MTNSDHDSPPIDRQSDGGALEGNSSGEKSSEELPAWMKSALGGVTEARVDVLRGVQERLRERSGGKFYKDGWATTRHAPFATYFLTALLMLAAVVLIYAIVTPVIPDPPAANQPVWVVPSSKAPVRQ